jgi:hypothetical protein
VDQNTGQPKYLNTAQAAERMKKSRESLRRKLRKGKIPGAHHDKKEGTWRIPEDSVVSWVNRIDQYSFSGLAQGKFLNPHLIWDIDDLASANVLLLFKNHIDCHAPA